MAVIHAVGPVWKGGSTGSEIEELRSCVIQTLGLADKLGMKSISMPALSSGSFGFPKDLCAEIIVYAAIDYLDANKASILSAVRIISKDADTLQALQRVFAIISKA